MIGTRDHSTWTRTMTFTIPGPESSFPLSHRKGHRVLAVATTPITTYRCERELLNVIIRELLGRQASVICDRGKKEALFWRIAAEAPWESTGAILRLMTGRLFSSTRSIRAPSTSLWFSSWGDFTRYTCIYEKAALGRERAYLALEYLDPGLHAHTE